MRITLASILLLATTTLFAQEVPIRKLSTTINRSQTNNSNPVLSGDGRYMIYISDLAREEGLKWWYTRKRSGGWTKQEFFDQKIDQSNVNAQGGFSLSADGNTILFTSKRYGSMGSYDIWISEKKGDTWGAPFNAGKPVNSNLGEGDPSLSPDGKYLFFTRCQNLGISTASGCDLYMAERKPNGYFNEPVKLPGPINSSSEVAPLMLSDNQTLVFASDRPGGKGGYDLYLSRKEGENWTEPIAFDFINTPEDDRYVSIPSKGDLAYFTKTEKGFKTIVMAKLPPEFQPRRIIWLNGKVSAMADGSPVKSVVQLKNLVNGHSEVTAVDARGFFSLYLAQGGDYDLSVLDPTGEYAFSSRRYNLLELEESRRQNEEFKMVMAQPSNGLLLGNVNFVENETALETSSEMELQRVLYLMKKRPSLNLEVGVYLTDYMEDSMQSVPDLTEVIIDTLIHTEIVERIDSVINHEAVQRLDSLLTEVNGTDIDSLDVESQEVDSIHQQLSAYERVVTYDTIYTEELKYTYHNDRSEQQAQEVVKFLTDHGAPPSRLSAVGYKDRRPEGVFDAERRRVVYIKFQ